MRASLSWLAVCGSLGLLLTASIASAGARAGDRPTPIGATTGVPGGATPQSAPSLEAESKYRGTVAGGAQQLWYRLTSDGAKVLVFEVEGQAESCPVRASVLDAHERTLGQLIASPGEVLPLVVRVPDHRRSRTYYLRIDADPFLACVGGDYAFTQLLPEAERHAPNPCGAALRPAAGRRFPVACAPSRTSFDAETCLKFGPALGRATVALAHERRLLARGRGSLSVLRRLENAKRVLARRAFYACVG